MCLFLPHFNYIHNASKMTFCSLHCLLYSYKSVAVKSDTKHSDSTVTYTKYIGVFITCMGCRLSAASKDGKIFIRSQNDVIGIQSARRL